VISRNEPSSIPVRSSDDLSIDIIVNNYNYGLFLGAAVDSALAQTHPRVRVIVVDDGSTDDSRSVLAAYAGRIELVLQDNQGQAAALNTGFVRSGADVVIFLDADDMLRPDVAARVAAVFARDPQVVKVQYRMEVVDDKGRRSGIIKPPRHLPLVQGDLCRAELVFPFDLPWLATSGNSFRADALRRIMPIPEREFAICADWYLVHMTPLLGTVVSLEEVGADYRVHGGNRYEQQASTLDLEHVRETIAYSLETKRALEQFSESLGLERPYGRILSVADLSNRLVSLKFAPDFHPIPTDRVLGLVVDGWRAALRRSDVSWLMRLMYIGWFASLAVVPRPAARRLAEVFFFPQKREALNRVLRLLHGRNRRGNEPIRAEVSA
jgi:glycosyltransferase involved in cell wall biosynthesis